MSHPNLHRISRGRSLSLGLVLAVASICRSAEPAEPFLRQLPAGVFLQSSVELSAAEARTIGKKLGGEIRRLTNSVVQVHGRPIRVNAITAADEGQAQAIHESLARINPHPFSLRSKPPAEASSIAGPIIFPASLRKTVKCQLSTSPCRGSMQCRRTPGTRRRDDRP